MDPVAPEEGREDIVLIIPLILLWLAPGSGEDGPFVYQFY